MKPRNLLLWSFLIGMILAVIPVVQRVALLPLYLDGYGQGPLSLVNRLSSLLLLPGKFFMYQVWPPLGHYFMTADLVIGAVINAAFYSLISAYLLQVSIRLKTIRKKPRNDARPLNHGSNSLTSPALETPPSPARRTFLIRSAIGVAGGSVLAAGLSPVLLVPGWIKVRRISFRIPGLPTALNGLTIAHLTDLHHDEWISIDHVRDAVRITNQLKPDIVALTGDYVTINPDLIRPTVRELARLRPRIGSLGVLGNHDWWAGAEETRRCFQEVDIPLVDNGRLFVSADRRLLSHASDGLCLAGVGDFWEDKIDVEKALHQVPLTMPRVLLSHNPDVAEEASLGTKENRIDLMLSGHTHGGQVRLPFVGTPIVPSAFGSKYVHGLAQGPHCAVQICAGIGMAMLPVRLGVPPEIVLVTLLPD